VARITVRVSAGAREDSIIGWRDDVLRVRVHAAAEQGKANVAVCRLIAKALGLPASSVSIARGATAREKSLIIEGIDDEEACRKLGRPSR
jgi:uncharacterized protein (TIGR00251 family)